MLTELIVPSTTPTATAPDSNGDTTPFHAGELAVQQRAGVADIAGSVGPRVIRSYMPEPHREFFSRLPFMVFGGIDAQAQPWATLRVDSPGFVSTPDPQSLRIDGGVLRGDPLAGQWRPGAMIGGLGIEPRTRRRNRINGVISAVEGEVITLAVRQSFGNCAKYIQGRTPTRLVRAPVADHEEIERALELSEADRALLARADTFFIASANLSQDAAGARGADVSHRGGPPGFVRVDNATTLTTPDFSGNRFFNTLGNLAQEPRAGLLFIDFDNGDMLYLAARAEIIWDGPELAAFPLAERLLRLRISEVRRARQALPLSWSAVSYAAQFAQLIETSADIPSAAP